MGWYEAIKDALRAADQLKDAELTAKMATVQMECAALAEDNARLREECNELKNLLDTREVMKFDLNVYWIGEGDDRVGPFCPTCWHGDERTARMQDRPDDHYWRCQVCGGINAQHPMRARARGRPRERPL